MAGPILRLKDMIAHTGLSRSTIYDRMDKKSPRYAEDFPKSFPLDGAAIGWFKSDIDAWLENCANTSNNGTPQKKSKTSLDSQIPAVHKPATSLRKSPSPPATPTKQSLSQAQPKRSSPSGNLAEAIVDGGEINARLLNYLEMTAWTPAMAAQLISGIAPALDCNEIPAGGIGLDEKPLHCSDARFHEARRILQDWQIWWEDEESRPQQMEPLAFLKWCFDQDVDTEWLRLFMVLLGFTNQNEVDLTGSRFALLTSR